MLLAVSQTYFSIDLKQDVKDFKGISFFDTPERAASDFIRIFKKDNKDRVQKQPVSDVAPWHLWTLSPSDLPGNVFMKKDRKDNKIKVEGHHSLCPLNECAKTQFAQAFSVLPWNLGNILKLKIIWASPTTDPQVNAPDNYVKFTELC